MGLARIPPLDRELSTESEMENTTLTKLYCYEQMGVIRFQRKISDDPRDFLVSEEVLEKLGPLKRVQTEE
jgi:hypothetical protein